MGMEIVDINIYTCIIQNAFQRIFGKSQLVLIDPHPDIPAKHRQHCLQQLLRACRRHRPGRLLYKYQQPVDLQRFIDYGSHYQRLRRKQLQQSILSRTVLLSTLQPDKGFLSQIAAVSSVDRVDRKAAPQRQLLTQTAFFQMQMVVLVQFIDQPAVKIKSRTELRQSPVDDSGIHLLAAQ